MIKVIVVDDHDLVRIGLVRLLQDVPGIRVVGEADSGESAVKLAKEHKPNVVLMDVRMPGMDGLEATTKIHESLPEIKILAVTACMDDTYPLKLLRAGASGYLTKDASSDDMVQALHDVMQGETFLSPEVAKQLALQSLQKNTSPFVELSNREMQITIMISTGKKVMEISSELHLSPKTVNTYRYRIFEKLDISSDVQLTHLALRHGLLEDRALSLS